MDKASAPRPTLRIDAIDPRRALFNLGLNQIGCYYCYLAKARLKSAIVNQWIDLAGCQLVCTSTGSNLGGSGLHLTTTVSLACDGEFCTLVSTDTIIYHATSTIRVKYQSCVLASSIEMMFNMGKKRVHGKSKSGRVLEYNSKLKTS